ncbi:MAG: hypothetical protein KDD52_03460 [Bdellovibrionales bacterium]|nr:hypothetical protein [Bdellovibrionales bacterium]
MVNSVKIRGSKFVLFLSMCFVACKLSAPSNPSPSVSPKKGAKDVPVNAAIKIHYPPELKVDEKKVNQHTQKVFVCPAKESPEFSFGVGTEIEDKQDTKEEQEGTSEESPSKNTKNQELKTSFRKVPEEDGSLNVFLIARDPIGMSPMETETQYCVETVEMENLEGKKIGGHTTEFTTDSSQIVFDEEAMVTILNQQNDEGQYQVFIELEDSKQTPGNLGLDFGDRSIHPEKLLKSLTLCEHQEVAADQVTSSVVDGECEGLGFKISLSLRMYSSLKENENHILTAGYSSFAVTSNRLREGKTYTLFLDGSKISPDNLYTQRFEFIVLAPESSRQNSHRQIFHHLSDSNPEKGDEEENDQSLLFHIGMQGG